MTSPDLRRQLLNSVNSLTRKDFSFDYREAAWDPPTPANVAAIQRFAAWVDNHPATAPPQPQP